MDDSIRNIMIQKLGMLMFANAELAAENIQLGNKVQTQAAEITQLKSLLADATKMPELSNGRPESMGENLPANPYNGAGDANPH